MTVQPDITGLLPERQTMNSSVTPFNFEGHTVRVGRDGNPWWVLNEVGKALEIANPRQAASRLDDDERGFVILDTPGGPQKFTIVNESGLNKLILTGRTAPAKRFTKWVTRDVLPTIRKTGTYSVRQPEQLVLSPEARSVVGGIMKRVFASQIRPLFQMQAVDHSNIVALKPEIATVKSAPVPVERGACRDYWPMSEIVKVAGVGKRGRR